MKTILISATCIAATLLLASCNVNVRTKDYRDSNKWGKVVTDKLDLDTFDEIYVYASVDVIFTQGDELKVKVEGNERAISEYTFNVEEADDDTGVHNRLMVEKARRLSYDVPSVRLYITAPDLKCLGIIGSGDFDIKDSVSIDELQINVSGSGDIDIRSLSCNNLDINLLGSGDVVIRELNGEGLTINVNGSGDADIRQATCSGVADFITKGSGDIDAVITAQSISAVAKGSGDIDLTVECDEISIQSQGTGEVEINGHANTLRKNSSMLGSTKTKKLKVGTVINVK